MGGPVKSGLHLAGDASGAGSGPNLRRHCVSPSRSLAPEAKTSIRRGSRRLRARFTDTGVRPAATGATRSTRRARCGDRPTGSSGRANLSAGQAYFTCSEAKPSTGYRVTRKHLRSRPPLLDRGDSEPSGRFRGPIRCSLSIDHAPPPPPLPPCLISLLCTTMHAASVIVLRSSVSPGGNSRT